jgi:FkbM family methyltransferase
MQQNDSLYSLLTPQRRTAIVDIGASDFGEAPPYRPLLDRGIATLIGFEPQPELHAKVDAAKGPLETYLPYAIGDGGRHTFYQCRFPAMSGFKKPDAGQLYQFIPLSEWGQIVGEVPMDSRRLDDVDEVRDLDFLKIDVEGSELDVFRAGRRKLSQAVVIWTEVSFIPIYENQAVFGEVDMELRSLGFVPHFIAGLFTRMIAPMMPPPSNPATGFRQLHAGDVIYCRDFAKMHELSDEQLKHMTLIAHHCLDSFDLAFRSVFELAKRGTLPPTVKEQYWELMKSKIATLQAEASASRQTNLEQAKSNIVTS